MRELNLQEAALVAGGNDTLNARVADACEGQPDSTNVTVTYTSSTTMGVPGIADRDATTTISLTANCGDYRNGLDDSGSEEGP